MTQPRTRFVPSATAPAVTLHSVIMRLIDIVVGTVLLAFFAPVLLITSLGVFLDSGLPVLYRCPRLGLHRQPITVLKFRTMANGSHHHLEALLSEDEELRMEYNARRKVRNDPRRTRVGSFLRRTSLDELPQLLNVVVGDMSLIGPRPYMPHELDGRPEAGELLSARPGITGLWQVNGRSDLTFEERIAYDLEYVRGRGLVMDLKIAVRTIGAVVSGRGAY